MGKQQLFDIFKEERFITKSYLDTTVARSLFRFEKLKKLISESNLDEDTYLYIANLFLKRSKKDCLRILNSIIIGQGSIDNGSLTMESLIPEKTLKLRENCINLISKEDDSSKYDIDKIITDIYVMRINRLIAKNKLDITCYSMYIYSNKIFITNCFYKDAKNIINKKTVSEDFIKETVDNYNKLVELELIDNTKDKVKTKNKK